MVAFDVAHIREQGQDMIIVPMAVEFGSKASAQQESIETSLRVAAHQAGLAGQIVTVWAAGNGRMGFRCPRQWTPFFTSISLRFVAANINKRVTVS